jgi:lipopolysaccharide/colanic/teichoic acid biosynthesis glycosyltransferase
MIQMKGFARKTRRSTKGGSLSAPSGMRLFFGNSIFRCFSTRKAQEAAKTEKPCGNGTKPYGSNGAKPDVKHDGEHKAIGSPAVNSLRTDVARFMQTSITELVSAERDSVAEQGRQPEAVESPSPSAPTGARPLPSRDDAELSDEPCAAIPRWKRTLDLTCILLASPFWLPLTLLVMIWIRITSPGPVFYRQERVGYRRGRFMIFKFRTMHANAETRTHEDYFAHLMRVDCPMTKLDDANDSRLIWCGRFLRASGLDELPQIFNVLRGEMSLVGPRPCLPSEFERYQKWQQARVNAPPGLTGYWQVNGKNKTTFSEMISMDLFYATNMSLRLDLSIMLKTVPALIVQTRESRKHTAGNGSIAHAAAEGLNRSIGKI